MEKYLIKVVLETEKEQQLPFYTVIKAETPRDAISTALFSLGENATLEGIKVVNSYDEEVSAQAIFHTAQLY